MAETKTITLAGASYDIPALPIKVVRKIVPLATRLAKLRFDPTSLSDADIDSLLEILFLGINFGRPSFTRPDLDAMVVPFAELRAAVQTIIMQAGMVASEGKPAAAG